MAKILLYKTIAHTDDFSIALEAESAIRKIVRQYNELSLGIIKKISIKNSVNEH